MGTGNTESGNMGRQWEDIWIIESHRNIYVQGYIST